MFAFKNLHLKISNPGRSATLPGFSSDTPSEDRKPARQLRVAQFQYRSILVTIGYAALIGVLNDKLYQSGSTRTRRRKR
jgi:hypothetical protein